ncbi:MAG: helix-turn-helix domain-containing protein, partial [Paracoccaceae bacterium]
MGSEYHPELRGFDSYELKLGDELRGERASLGKSLLDVQRDLKIRADYIAAIEDANAAAFPFAGFAAGYVRAYARYLGLDGDDIYRRFCAESGFVGVSPTNAMTPRQQRAA